MSKSRHEENRDRIGAKRKELQGESDALAMYFEMGLDPKTKSLIQTLQDRLEYRTAFYEEALLDEKLKIYKEAVALARKAKSTTLA